MDHHVESDPTGSLPPALLNCLLRMLAAALPAEGVSPEIVAENQEAACALFFAMHPRDPTEAAAAVRTIAAHFASMDMYARAARPGLATETVVRLHASAVASARMASAAQRPAHRTTAPAAKPPKPAAAPPQASSRRVVLPLPIKEDRFQPHDRHGQPIPRWDTLNMTRAQTLAMLAYPRDPELEKAALADEAAMRAEQQAEDSMASATEAE